MKQLYLLLLFTFLAARVFSQDELLNLLGEEVPQKEYVTNAFKATRVINGHSMEQLAAGVLDFRISHRFGRLNGGAYQLYGLDQATIRLGLDYGLTNRLMAGVGRSSGKKEIDGFLKYRLIWQSKGNGGLPFSLILVSGMTINGLKFQNPEQRNYFSSRLAYYYQVILGRKFNDRFTLQFTPTMVHRNLVDSVNYRHDIYALGTQARFKLSKRIALMVEHFYVLPGSSNDLVYSNSLSLGFDIETGGHVFQLHFTNAHGMNERALIADTDGKWNKGDIQFGFNISRVFTISDHRK